MGSVVKGVGSLFGGRARRREQRSANRALDTEQAKMDAFKFTNVYEGMQGPEYQAYEAAQAQAAQLGPAEQAQLAELGQAQGYDAQGYTAAQTNVAGLMRGADTGLTNTMRNLQVSTAGAEMAAQEADQALAASQDLAAQAGTGAGGATALAAQAAKSKAGIAADIDRQVKANEQLRAQGESELQRAQLAQGNLASQFDLGQQQFNVGAQNQASQFTADAQNQAARFGAQAANQFALTEFGAANQMNQFNVGQQNQFAVRNMDAQNQFALSNMGAQNQALMNQANVGNQQADRAFDIEKMKRDFQLQQQNFEYQKLQNKTDRALARKQAADQARAQAKADLIGGIGGILDAGVMAATGGFGGDGLLGPMGGTQSSDRRLKKDIKLIGLSPLGFKIYSFKYKDNSFGNGTFQGVMSDEVPNYAVIKSNGFDMVDYNKIDVEFKNI
tara:strand:- start:762 stop:2093 length:1332 start_codon:yes stop_codon:yes gene_type:complete